MIDVRFTVTTPRFVATDGNTYSLVEVLESWWAADPVPLRPPETTELAAWATTADHERAMHLVLMVTAYPAFVPPLSDERRLESLLEGIGGRQEGGSRPR